MRDLCFVSMVRVSVPDDAGARVQRILAYINENLATATLTSTAEHFGFHPNTLENIVKRETGMTFGAFLRKVRMERALDLLGGTDLSVAQVGAQCGYENPSNFFRVFKEAFGTSPRAYGVGAGTHAAAVPDPQTSGCVVHYVDRTDVRRAQP